MFRFLLSDATSPQKSGKPQHPFTWERQAKTEIENLTQELQRNQEYLDLMQHAAHIGIFKWDILKNAIVWTKDEFMGIVSHGLRTSVANMKVFGQVLQNRLQKAGDQKSIDLLKKYDSWYRARIIYLR